MTRKKRNVLIVLGASAIVALIGLIVAARAFSSRFEPFIQAQTIEYLEQRFDSDVELKALHIGIPSISPVKLFLRRGRGIVARVEGEGLSMRHKGGDPDIPPLFVMKTFNFEVDLGMILNAPRIIHSVTIDGMDINIPPRKKDTKVNKPSSSPNNDANVIIEEVLITNSSLSILPADKAKTPLHFALHSVKLESAGRYVAMKYDATLTNPKPPGEIHSVGNFGPWDSDDPGETPLDGDYQFNNADLGVFSGISGILNSTGHFEGNLSSITARGTASVPQFRLTSSGNPVPLTTNFEVLVDGTNGNTILKPVKGTIGTTAFTTSGGVVKFEGDDNRTIKLDVSIPNGSLHDVLTLGMKGKTFMEGRIALKAKIDIPPLEGKVSDKLRLSGQFEISKAKFLQSKIQNQIDALSRRAQGQPKDESIVEVPSGIGGTFRLADQVITFTALSFAVEGAGIDLHGNYNLDQDVLDFHGVLRLQAKVSQTMTGWKRWVLKPVDPFFAKEGAGTLLHIQVVGSSKNPDFGRDHGEKATP